jgi:hypothetical protein
MRDCTRNIRLQIMMSKEELQAIDNWRFTQRMASRAAGVRKLINLGLKLDHSLNDVKCQHIAGPNADGSIKREDYSILK